MVELHVRQRRPRAHAVRCTGVRACVRPSNDLVASPLCAPSPCGTAHGHGHQVVASCACLKTGGLASVRASSMPRLRCWLHARACVARTRHALAFVNATKTPALLPQYPAARWGVTRSVTPVALATQTATARSVFSSPGSSCRGHPSAAFVVVLQGSTFCCCVYLFIMSKSPLDKQTESARRAALRPHKGAAEATAWACGWLALDVLVLRVLRHQRLVFLLCDLVDLSHHARPAAQRRARPRRPANCAVWSH